MKVIKITQGYKVFVDDEDYDLLNKHSWCAFVCGNSVYAQMRFRQKAYLMHRYILKPKKSELIDHVDGNGLNNRRINLRITNRTLNSLNWYTPRINKSGIRGVYLSQGGWSAEMTIYKIKYRKWFLRKEDAVKYRRGLEIYAAGLS